MEGSNAPWYAQPPFAVAGRPVDEETVERPETAVLDELEETVGVVLLTVEAVEEDTAAVAAADEDEAVVVDEEDARPAAEDEDVEEEADVATTAA